MNYLEICDTFISAQILISELMATKKFKNFRTIVKRYKEGRKLKAYIKVTWEDA